MKNRKKLVALIMVLAIALTTLVGGTLAYFTDNDEEANVFTMGNVEIDLQEDFGQNANLLPGVDVEKRVRVKNTGSNDAYVRVHIAVPAELDSFFNTDRNFLHVDFSEDSVSYLRRQWSWRSTYIADEVGYVEGDLNSYETVIRFKAPDYDSTQRTIDIPYNVYVVTYRSELGSGETTGTDVIDKVYLDTAVNATAEKAPDENGEDVVVSYTYFYNEEKDNAVTLTAERASNIQILIVAEGSQTAPFKNAYEALNTTFGVPSTTNNPWYGKLVEWW